MAETERQRFLRNHTDSQSMMRMVVQRALASGDTESAERIQGIIDEWDRIAEIARQQEEAEHDPD